jgi:hypothetical protein
MFYRRHESIVNFGFGEQTSRTGSQRRANILLGAFPRQHEESGMGHGRRYARNEGRNLSLNCLLIYYDKVGSDEARRFYCTMYGRELPS